VTNILDERPIEDIDLTPFHRPALPPTFGSVLREYRRAAGLSQRALAAKCGCDFTYICKLENDRMPAPSERLIEAFTEACGKPKDERLLLLGGFLPADVRAILESSFDAVQLVRAVAALSADEIGLLAELAREFAEEKDCGK
jgi:transcriptional regulator with XRE-family HTH domain